MSKSCVSCKYEPVWNEVGTDGDGWPQLEGMCRALRAACDTRHKIVLDTEYMIPECGMRILDCKLWEPKNES